MPMHESHLLRTPGQARGQPPRSSRAKLRGPHRLLDNSLPSISTVAALCALASPGSCWHWLGAGGHTSLLYRALQQEGCQQAPQGHGTGTLITLTHQQGR